MRVTVRTNTPSRLDLRLRPVSTWAYWAFGAAFVIAGAWAGTTLGRAMDLHCERTGAADGTCSLAL